MGVIVPLSGTASLMGTSLTVHVGSNPLSGSLLGDALVSITLIALPTAMMGASLPLLTQGLSRSLEDAAPFHAKIYVLNTLGAFVGAVSAGFHHCKVTCM